MGGLILSFIGRKEKWQLELGEERGQKSLKKFAPKVNL